jgi:hypothetical protein
MKSILEKIPYKCFEVVVLILRRDEMFSFGVLRGEVMSKKYRLYG